MDINYKILWFEDTDEAFDTLSRRTERYVNSKNLRCSVERLLGAPDFKLSDWDLNTYEILVVDLRLSEDSKGFEIIKQIRAANYVNDILFYSAEGVAALDEIMREYGLEGVFVVDRNNKTFIPKIQQLIDKSIRRSENIINIRGIVMDETSEFDTQMCEITTAALTILKEEEIAALKKYITNDLLSTRITDLSKLAEKYGSDGLWSVSDIVSEYDFTSMMKAKLLNRILNCNSNPKIVNIVENCKAALPKAFEKNTVKFVSAYDDEILKFRNKLAHVKQLNAPSPVFIGRINDRDYYCNAEFCSEMRASLIRYGKWFDTVYDSLQDG